MKKAVLRLVLSAVTLMAWYTLSFAAYQPEAERVIKADTGTDFTVSFDSNKTTGYEWMLSKSVDPAMLQVVGEKYVKDKPLMAGQPGKQEWTFKALKAGKTTLEFKHSRPWKEDVSTAPPFIFTVVISDHKPAAKSETK